MTGIRTVLGVAIGLLAALKGGNGAATAHQQSQDQPPRVQASTMAGFIALLRRDEGLRARFSQDPQTVMRAHGIDPAPFNLHRLDAAARQRLLFDLAQKADPQKPPADTSPKPSTDKSAPVAPPYGPPPRPPDDSKNPPAPVYGPAPKPR